MTTELDPQHDLNNPHGWLPDDCPPWCEGSHAAALVEGCGWPSAQMHIRGGPGECLSELRYAGRPVREWGAGWNLQLQQRPLPTGGFWGPALISVDMHDSNQDVRLNLALTSGEARTLARQLVAMADVVDL